MERVEHASDALVAGTLRPRVRPSWRRPAVAGRPNASWRSEKRHEELELRPLSDDARERYIEEWQATQTRFVDDPTGAVSEADDLVQRVMRDRGYPVDDFEQRAADISVEHPELVERYRTANGIARASERGEASTEDLRHSVRHYRALFVELLEVGDDDQGENVNDVGEGAPVSRLR